VDRPDHAGVLRARDAGEQRVTPLELFFDLVYVFAITQLSHLLLDHPTVGGALETLFLLLVVWWAWQYTTWFTNWHRGFVGYSKEHTLCIFEAHGPLDRETAAELLGWARPRDLERLHLEPLSELGLLEKRGGIYAVPGDYRERRESVLGEEYSTVQPRVRRERSVEGRNVYVVRDSGIVASESERLRLAEEQHARERDGYRNRAANPADPHYVNVGVDGHIEDLERVDELSEADSRTLEAIEAFEGKYGSGSFRWDRASCKELFYSGPIGGFWPEPEELWRIRDYLALVEGAA
jgi:hypothetical protein